MFLVDLLQVPIDGASGEARGLGHFVHALAFRQPDRHLTLPGALSQYERTPLIWGLLIPYGHAVAVVLEAQAPQNWRFSYSGSGVGNYSRRVTHGPLE